MRGIMKRTLGIILSALAILILASSCCFCMRMHTVTIDPANGDEVETVIVEDGKLLEEPDRPRRSGYSFIGWYNEATDEKYDFSLPVRSDLTIIAHWTRNTPSVPSGPSSFTVKFDVNLPEGYVESSIPDMTVDSGSGIEDGSLPSKPEIVDGKGTFNFLGWYTEEGIQYTAGMAINEDTTLYARWESVWDGYSKDAESIEEQMNDPDATEIIISTAAQLAGIVDIVGDRSNSYENVDFNKKPIQLVNDIDLAGNEWTTIGYHNETRGEDCTLPVNLMVMAIQFPICASEAPTTNIHGLRLHCSTLWRKARLSRTSHWRTHG